MSATARQPRLVSMSDVVATPWRNGKGTTRELIAWPSTEAWQLRFSVADIENDGPFSAWPGVVREFCVLDGAGVVLSWGDGRKERLRPGTPPLRFDGGDPPWAQLVDGPTRDLNLMTRGGLDARLESNDGGVRSRPWACFVAERGAMLVDGVVLDVPGTTLAWFDEAPTGASFEGRAWWLARGEGRAA